MDKVRPLRGSGSAGFQREKSWSPSPPSIIPGRRGTGTANHVEIVDGLSGALGLTAQCCRSSTTCRTKDASRF